MKSELNNLQQKDKFYGKGKIDAGELMLLTNSDFFKYLPEKTQRKINQVLLSSEQFIDV